MPFAIILPERHINLYDSKAVLKYLLTASPLAGKLLHQELLHLKPLAFQCIIQLGPATIPLQIRDRGHFLHFETRTMTLPSTPATLLQTHMWTKRASTALVCPFASTQDDGTILFTVSGGLLYAKVRKSMLDAFLNEQLATCMFVLQCHFELGPQGPSVSSQQKPNWVAELAKKEATGPRRSEFDLTPRVKTLPCKLCGTPVELKGVTPETPTTNPLCLNCLPPKKEDATHDHPDQ